MIGIFGGTFDPPHIGHLILADEARGRLALDSVRWVVTGVPPHKPDRPITPVEHRLAMVRMLMDQDAHFVLSTVEVDRPGPHYAAETLELLSQAESGQRWAYLMGKDSLRDLPTWHQPERLVELSAAIVVLNRPDIQVDLDHLDDLVPGLSDKLHYLQVPLIDVASSVVRRRVADGSPYRYLVPPPVAGYISEHGLYR